jgi:mono/diheme cytochrome c family protein
MDPRSSQGPDRIDYREAPGDLTEVHAAIQREHRDPSAETTPIPLWLAGVCGAALVWAGGYFMTFHGGLRGDVFNERLSSPELLFPQTLKPGGPAGGETAAAVSLAQAGKSVYSNCQPCHQAAGQGVPGQFPTLVNTDFVKSERRIIAILLKGIQGPLNVNGATINGAMPAWEKALSDKKIAQVASYVRSSFGNTFPEISEAKVAAARKELAAQTQPWTEADLLQMPADVTTGEAPGAAPAAPASGGKPAAGAQAPAAAPAVDLMAIGKANYNTICVACHQPTGLGLPSVFPPIAKSEYANGDPKRLVAIILKGVMGPITVEGKAFNNAMPGQEAMLTEQKIAGVATYVRKSFGNDASEVTPELVAVVKKQFASRATPWTEAELKAFPGGGAAPAPAP